MHNAAFAELGVAAIYTALDIAPNDLWVAVDDLRSPDVLGASVTVPHKRAIVSLLDRLTPQAEAVGAVNTVTLRDGALEGHNTDVEGVVRSLAELPLQLPGTRALLLGAGGAARAVAVALLGAGVAELRVANRTADRAEQLAADVAHLGPVAPLPMGELEGAVASCDLLINSTSVGMERGGVAPEVSPLPPGLLPERGVVVDIVYRPARTRLLRDAEAVGLTVQNGVPMLVYQGAAAFERWLGVSAPVATMRSAVERALASAP
jgi:shikimate dehydrogenase